MPEAGTGVLGTRIREQAKTGRRGGTRLMQSREVPGASTVCGGRRPRWSGAACDIGSRRLLSRGHRWPCSAELPARPPVLGPHLALRWAAGGPTPVAWTPAVGHFGRLWEVAVHSCG